MCLKCVSNERLEKKLAEGLPVIFGIDRPELVHQRTYSQPAYLLEHNTVGPMENVPVPSNG